MGAVLIVGGAGYVGSVLTRGLAERGHAVRVLDLLLFGDQGLREIRDRIELHVGDMRQVPREVLDGVEWVVNVGGLSNDPSADYDPQLNHELNTVASVELARLSRRCGVRRYIYASSCSVYDRGILDETRDVVLDERAEVEPTGAYAGSKLAAERSLLAMADDRFCVSVLRKGTLFGFSPRMRYDLVVNTFVKDALSRGYITLHRGGEMWRPLADVRDAARAYAALMSAAPERCGGEVFNLVHRNMRLSELALRVRAALMDAGVEVAIKAEYDHPITRSYRVSGMKLQSLGIRTAIGVEESVADMLDQIRRHGYTDFEHPRYSNIASLRRQRERPAATGHGASR